MFSLPHYRYPGHEDILQNHQYIPVFKGLVKGECIRFLRSTSDPSIYQDLITKLGRHLRFKLIPLSSLTIVNSILFSLSTSYVIPPNTTITCKGPIVVTTYSLWLSSHCIMQALTQKWDLLKEDTFPEPLMVTFRQNRSIGGSLIRACLSGDAPPSSTRVPHTCKLPHIIRTVTPC